MEYFQCFTLVLLCLEGFLAIDLPKDGCRAELKINNNQYNVSNTYHVNESYPTDAHYDHLGNLFFVESGRNDMGYNFNVKVLKDNTSTPTKVNGLPENLSYSIAVDKKEKTVYFGTGKGIYKYDYESHEATPVSNGSVKLDMIFVDKDSKKYITESNDGISELYLLDGGKKIPFKSLEALNELAIDDKNNFYYIKEEKLYVLKSTHSIPIYIGNVTYDGMAQITVHKDHVYVASDDLVYFHENDTGNLKLVKNAPENVTAIAFDHNGNFILGVRGKIIKYKKNECHHRNNKSSTDQKDMP